MGDTLAIALSNLGSPMVLFFALGAAAALARSDLSLPEAVAKALALYLMLAIGFKGGVGVAAHGVDLGLVLTLVAGALLSAFVPLVAFVLLSWLSSLPRVDRAAVAGHYGSISIVTLVAASESVRGLGLGYEGYIVAVAAVMETPAILVALWLAARGRAAPADADAGGGGLFREIALNGSVVVLVGAFAIGMITGEKGLADIAPFIVDPFKGILCLFLLDMGVIAGRGLRAGYRSLTPGVVAFGLVMPLVGAAIASPVAWLVGLSAGGAALLVTLTASASYIAVPAAMRVALPEARPAIYLTLSLGITFPFNLTFGIPLYAAIGRMLAS
jgi:hypothetical protein